MNPQTFRTDSEGALSYFVAGNENYPQDSGFALKNWTKCEVENAGVFITSDSASTMGKVHFTNADGEVTSVDKTWKFVKDEQGTIRIALHHSSLEYISE
ncbi:putative phosphoribosyl-AMP cyclohydrolase [Vibrio ishigakensis]|uniref:Putative phosphoribosyl-AMP cyclohydrolase n=1 Tax=Vibrio ishigakensis TaxID=1481914 RepID=A0A0B8P3Y1_9VIBR|nr:putative phosphoribosyl-AMP cyclohydrolase [Vibrio ishigakensis]